jgi:hypothetical protein
MRTVVNQSAHGAQESAPPRGILSGIVTNRKTKFTITKA